MSKRSAKAGRVPVARTEKASPVATAASVRKPRSVRVRREHRGRPLERPAPQSGASRASLRRIPRVAWICALVACLNALGWAFVTPPFQSPDETDHFAYVKQLAETGSLPTSSAERYSAEEAFVLRSLHAEQTRLSPSVKAIFSGAEQAKLKEGLAGFAGSPEKGSSAAGVAAAEPPLFYALETVPYSLGSGGTLLGRLQLMRLLSALFAGVTALFTYLFLRETLPRVRWAWTVGALGVALTPLFGFMSGMVNPDALLFAVSAMLFYCIARAFRRGLTRHLAIATGLVIAAGFTTKVNFAGLAPGAYLALILLAVRERRAGRPAVGAAATAAGIGCVPVAVYALSNVLAGHPALGIVASGIDATHGTVLAGASYVWQLYLPRLPGMANDFPGLFTTRELWFDGFVGRLGWLDTFFPAWVYTVALVPAALIVGLFARALLASRAALRGRLPELAVYVAMALGMMALVGADAYRASRGQATSYAQARYLLPLLPLLGALLALAARGAGRRWGPAVGASILVLLLAHDLFSQMQLVARFYG